ncbi:MAG: long-chain fatty acid--CoA ligase [Smithella sp.]|jgi:long-chain acyl-CoA synthetase
MKTASDIWYLTIQTFPELLHRNATEFGSRRAQWWKTKGTNTESITYSQLSVIVSELSAGLLKLGIAKGDRACIMAHTSPPWVWADYSILCGGAITVCIYPTVSPVEIKHIVNDSGARFVYVDDEENLKKIKSVWPDMPTLEKVIFMKDDYAGGDNRVISLSALRKLGRELQSSDTTAYEQRWRSVTMDDPMTIVYTSGTTGLPKGAVHTHRSINAACRRDLSVTRELNVDDVCLSFLPLSHTYERECGHGCAMHSAITIAYSDPKTLVDDMRIFRPTIFMSVPRLFERIYMTMQSRTASSPVKKAIFDYAMKTGLALIETRTDKNGFIDMSEGIDLTAGVPLSLKLRYKLVDKLMFSKVREMMGGRLSLTFSAAGSLPADLCKVFLAMGIRICEGYGATETCNTININLVNKILPGSVGPVAPGVEGKIAEDGEWLVKGENIFKGYWNNPEATNDAFTPDGFYKTGDIVVMLADGYLKIVDRKKGLMVLDTGKNVPSAKIEAKFSLSRFIEVVMPVGDNRKYVSALVVPNFDAFIRHFDDQGIVYDRDALVFSDTDGTRICTRVGQDFIDKPELKTIIDADIQKVNAELEEYERVKKYLVLPRKLTVEEGEMTPTMKVKRNEVLKHFKAEIESLYE